MNKDYEAGRNTSIGLGISEVHGNVIELTHELEEDNLDNLLSAEI